MSAATKKKPTSKKSFPAPPAFKTARSQAAPPPPVVKVKKPTTTACGHCGVVFDKKAFEKHLVQAPCSVYLDRAGITSREARSFAQAVQVPEPTPQQAEARAHAMVMLDPQSHVAIELRRTEAVATIIPYDLAGLEVRRVDLKEVAYDPNLRKTVDRGYAATWKPQADYPTGRAAQQFLGFAIQVGATTEALAELAKLVNITQKEREMATAALTTNKEKATKTVAVNAGKHGVVKVKAERKTRDSAASMYKGLIMEGKLTDEDIFATVKKAFPDSKGSAGYVGWYRNALKKEGKNPPARKEVPSAAKPKAAATPATKTPKK